jgi:hypothetical protein
VGASWSEGEVTENPVFVTNPAAHSATAGVVDGDRKNGEVANYAVSVVLRDGAHALQGYV